MKCSSDGLPYKLSVSIVKSLIEVNKFKSLERRILIEVGNR